MGDAHEPLGHESSPMSVVFVNCTAETFTPTRSGAICTWLWELCRAAQRQDARQDARRDGLPWVITKTSPAAPYDWPNTIFVDYPHIPKNRLLSKLWYLHRDLTGWGHVRQKRYNLRVAAAIRRAGLQDRPLLLNNDIELAVYLRRRFPRSFILHLAHNDNPCRPKFRRQFKDSVNAAAAVSDHCGQWNLDYFGLDEISTLYAGVDLDRFTPAPERPPGPPLINFVGRTDNAKAPDLLLHAAMLLAQKTKDFRLQILGSNHYGWSEPDDYQRRLQALAAQLEADGIPVRLPGFVDRYALPDELRKAHINVVPSRWPEPFGLVTPEGMACGLATVGSRTGGTPEIIADAGFLFERDDVDALAGHLERLVCDEPLRAEYGRRARKRAEWFTWDRTWTQLRALMGA